MNLDFSEEQEQLRDMVRGVSAEYASLEVVRAIVRLVGADPELIRFVEDRPGHDRRYAMDHGKVTDEFGWRPARSFEEGLAETVTWYREHTAWVAAVRSGAYRGAPPGAAP